MIIICTLKEMVVEGKKKAKGRKLRLKYLLAFDRYNVVYAIQRGSVLIGEKYYPNIEFLASYLIKQGYDPKELRSTINKGFNDIFSTNFKPRTFKDIDKTFNVSERRQDSSGILTIYDRLKKVVGDNNNDENDD